MAAANTKHDGCAAWRKYAFFGNLACLTELYAAVAACTTTACGAGTFLFQNCTGTADRICRRVCNCLVMVSCVARASIDHAANI
jgi:hypothetical protein